jgi:heat shock protein HslJ
MACPGGASQLEAQVVAVLDGKVAYTIDGDQLTLVNGGNGLVYTAS